MALTKTVTNPGVAPVDTQVYDVQSGYRISVVQIPIGGSINVVGKYTPLMQRQLDTGTLVESLTPMSVSDLPDRPDDALPTSLYLALLNANAPTVDNPVATIADIGPGGGSLAALADVGLILPLADGEVLTYDALAASWTNKAAAAGFSGAYTHVHYVDIGAAGPGTGTLADPYPTIKAALDAIGQPADAAEFQENHVIEVLSVGGNFADNLTVPHRAITIMGRGFTISGNITREISNEKEYGVSSSVWRGTLSIVSTGIVDARDTHQANRQAIKITGNYRCKVIAGETGSTTHDTFLCGVDVQGTFTADDGVVNGGAPSVGTDVLYAWYTRFQNVVEGRTFYCQRWKNSSVSTSTFIVSSVIMFEDVAFANGDEWAGYGLLSATISSFTGGAPQPYVVPTFVDCAFYNVTLTVPAGQTVRMDAESYRTWASQVTPSNPVSVVREATGEGVSFDPTGTNIVATDVQAAIAELASQFPQYASSVILYVDPNHPKAADDGNVATPFVTIMGAINAIPKPPANDYLVHIAPGTYPENVVINHSRINLMGAGFLTTKIQPAAGLALEYRPVDAVTGPHDNRVHDLGVMGDVVVNGETAPASGIFYPSMCGNELMFVDCSIYGNMTFDRANYLSAQGIFVNGDVSFNQCAGQWWNFSEISGTLTIDWLTGAPNPTSDNSNYGWSPYDGTVADITLLNEGKVVAKNHTISGTLTLSAAPSRADLFACFVNTLANPGGGTVNNIGDYYDNTVVSALAATDVQGAIDELALRNLGLTGVGNPNGVVNGQYPQTYLDTATNTPYINTGVAPNNNLWVAI